MDNRKRLLKLGSVSENASDICRKNDNTTSKYPGVCLEGTKWRAKIAFNNNTYHLGTYTDEKEAGEEYAKVFEKRSEIEAKLKTINEREDQIAFVKSYVSQKIITTLSKFRGVKKHQKTSGEHQLHSILNLIILEIS